MSEFGHFYTRGTDVCIDAWGAGPFVIEAGGKTFRFEDSDRFGPYLVKRNGEMLANPYPGPRSPFWKAHLAWRRRGRRLADDGVTCIYEPLRPDIYYVRGRQIVHTEEGDEGGGIEIREMPAPKRRGG